MENELPENLKKKIDKDILENWNEVQIKYILNHQGKKLEQIKEFSPHADYTGKAWDLDKARSEYGEICADCKYPYCFYAEPRNWSMGSDSDVWNLMKCGNVNCGKYFESCL